MNSHNSQAGEELRRHQITEMNSRNPRTNEEPRRYQITGISKTYHYLAAGVVVAFILAFLSLVKLSGI